MKKNNLKKTDICRLLEISQPTLEKWIQKPGTINLKYIIMLSGLLNIRIEVLVYLLSRNKPKVNSNVKKHWLSEDIDTEINKFKKNTDIN